MAALPTSADTAQLEAQHAAQLSSLAQRAAALEKRPLTAHTAQLAIELDTEAKHWLEAFDHETKPVKDALFKAHRLFTSFCTKLSAGPAATRATCRLIIGKYAYQQRQSLERAQREAEARAREAAAAQRQAELDAITAEAAATNDPTLLEAAVQLEAAPLAPVIIDAPAPPRLDGISVSFRKVATVSDARKVLAALLARDSDDLINEIIEWKQSGLNAQVRRGLVLDGVAVHEESVTSNRMRT